MATEQTAQRILVIADTHNKLPPVVTEAARIANEIWHLGDVCSDALLQELKLIGPPVTLVRGNCDTNPDWRLMLELTRNSTRFRLQHIPPSPRQALGACDMLLHGHTHVPRDEIINGVRFLNPGCVTRPSRGAPPSFAWLEFQQNRGWTWTLQTLR
ncbi:MAG: metallophosphoesterase family protein [Verrucomicrobia bacterium]|nr:metallophosphoesterase family protein [Verrucomicrobiota bacterium]